MATIQQDLDFNNDLPTRLPDFKPPSSFVRRFKNHDKTTKRDMIGAEAAEKQRQKDETAKTKRKQKKKTATKKADKKRLAVRKSSCGGGEDY